MIWKVFAEPNGIRWGAISLVMCIAIYVVGFTLKYEWQWMFGAPFNIFYMFALIGVVGIPILLLIQCFKMGYLWTKQRTIPLNQIILFSASTVLYGALVIFRKEVFDW